MEERRRNKRIGLSSKLLIKRLDGEDAAKEVDIDAKTGVGFLCSEALEIGAVYEASLTIWTKEVIHAFLEIVRIEKKDDNIFSYGSIFIGMSEIEASRIETYSTIETMEV